MLVTESDLDPKPRNFLITMRKISPACDLAAKMLLILKNIIFDQIIQG